MDRTLKRIFATGIVTLLILLYLVLPMRTGNAEAMAINSQDIYFLNYGHDGKT